jgi:tetratricopeptide (TPR) repeat protein
MRPALVLSLLLIAAPAFAVAPPPKPAPPTKPDAVDALLAQLQKADSPEDAHAIESKIENQFRVSGSPSVDLLMTRVQTALGAQDNKTATQLIDAVTQIAPNFAEGWHVRAGMEAAANDDTSALVSLQKTVTLNPRNFAALSELGDMLQDYGDKKAALELYRRALALDPQLDNAARKIRELHQAVEGRDI